MRKLVFNCTFQGDVILNANTATEGNTECLDFIPGSNFLGMAARNYNSLDMSFAYEVFHSGSVQFGDAHPLQNGERAFRKPAAWFLQKGKSDTDGSPIYIHHLIPDEDRKQIQAKGIQLKQIRGGFFLQSGKTVETKSFFTLKSAHDREHRKSKDEAMFGFTALRRGSVWQFIVGIPEDEKIEEFVISSLSGVHGLGRSRSAQFGRVVIDLIETHDSEPRDCQQGEVIIYASSRWILLDCYGIPTALPTAENMGLPCGSKVDFAKSQIRTYTYAPWNGKRSLRDADRVCIEKGSVVVVNLSSEHYFKENIGEYKAEGNGHFILNPDFLKKSINVKKPFMRSSMTCDEEARPEYISTVSEMGADKKLIKFLKYRKAQFNNKRRVIQAVSQFVENEGKFFVKISSSQWRQIRNTAINSNSIDDLYESLFAEKTGLLMHGIKEEVWRGKPRKKFHEFIQNNVSELSIALVVSLASEMQKESSREGN